jgi:hypothetical protein
MIELMLELYPWLPVGVSLLSRCRQNKVWTTREGETIRVSKIGKSHAQNLVRWLEKRAVMIHKAASICAWIDLDRHDGGEAAHDSIEEEACRLEETDPLEFLRALPLYVKVLEKSV